MSTQKQPQKCYACNGELEEGTTTFTVDFGSGVVVVRNVPARVCSQCGLDYIDDDVAEKIEQIVNEAREKQRTVEVLSMTA